MKKLLSSILMTTALLVSLVGCGGTEPEQATEQPADTSSEAPADDATTDGVDTGLIEDGKIYVATSPDYPPFEFLDGTELTGFDVELFNAVAEQAGLEVVWDQLSFETIISAVQTGQYDVGVSAFSVDPERQVLFTEPYYESAQVALLPADSSITTIDELKDGKLAAGPGTTGETAAKTLSEDVKPVPTNTGFPMLLAGQIDSYICDYGVALNAVETGKYKMIETPITEESFSMIVKEDNQALCDLLNDNLATFMETQEYTDLLAKYELNK